MSSSTSQSTGLLTAATTVVSAYPNILDHVQINTDGTNNATVTVYDNTAASGKIVCQRTVLGANQGLATNLIPPVKLEVGLTVTIAGTGASAIVGYGAA